MKISKIQKHGVAIVLFLATILFSGLVLTQSASWMGKAFPGYLTFKNGVVGAFYMPSWDGYQEGKTYHYIAGDDLLDSTFATSDYWGVVVVPVLSGLLFFLFGLGLYFFSPFKKNKSIFLLLHFLIGNYLILTPDFHMNHQYSFLMLLFFSFIPACAVAFAHAFPSTGENLPRWPWVVSGIFFLMHVIFFDQPQVWLWVEKLLLIYVIFSYVYWIYHQFQILEKPAGDFQRILATYLLRGQIFAFILPLIATICIFIFDAPIPLNFMAPLILLFPILFFIGLLLSKISFDRLQFSRIERRATLGNLLTGLSHELNNPLNFIYAAIDPLKDNVEQDKDKEGSLELISTMQEGASRMKNILEGFRLYSHPGNGQKKNEHLHHIIDQTLKLLAPQWTKGITVKKVYANEDQLVCSNVELGQVCMNILQNAADSIVDKGTISIETQSNPETMTLVIRDDGCGIEKNVTQRIFDPFYTSKDQGEGTGLGLSIVMEIITQHQGTIEVDTEVGKGTAFIITLPRS